MRLSDIEPARADDGFFTALGIIFACAITVAAAMVLILPQTAAGRAQTDYTQLVQD